MMTRYQLGANRERALKKKLEDEGYFVVRSSGSHTALDLVAFKPNSILLIQVKGKSHRAEGRRELGKVKPFLPPLAQAVLATKEFRKKGFKIEVV